MNKEIWKDVKNYEGLYQVSNLGNIRKIQNRKYDFKTSTLKLEKVEINMTISEHLGYKTVKLTDKFGKRRHLFLHRIIAETFIQNPNNYKVVNHIDCNKHNNDIKNLEWVTQKENVKHAWKNKLCETTRIVSATNGKKCSKKIIQLDKENNIVKVWDSTMDIERTLGIRHANISICCKNHKRTAKGFYWRYYTEIK